MIVVSEFWGKQRYSFVPDGRIWGIPYYVVGWKYYQALGNLPLLKVWDDGCYACSYCVKKRWQQKVLKIYHWFNRIAKYRFIRFAYLLAPSLFDVKDGEIFSWRKHFKPFKNYRRLQSNA